MPLREFDLIDRYFSPIGSSENGVLCGIGDDAAVVQVADDEDLVVCVDTLVSGVHFFSDVQPYDLGYKSLAVNLSDIAAMAAKPRWATLSLTLPEANEDWLGKFAEGFSDLAAEHNVSLIGGDTTKGPLSVSVQVLGSVKSGRLLKRSGARAGDLIYVSGDIGGPALACRQLGGGLQGLTLSETTYQRFHRPQVRVDLGQIIPEYASAAIDISDGLAADIEHLLKASGVGARIQTDKIPLSKSFELIKGQPDYWQLALAGGDDYELCFSIPEDLQKDFEGRVNDLPMPAPVLARSVKKRELYGKQKQVTRFR